MKPVLLSFGLLFLLTIFVLPANAQQNPNMVPTPPPNGAPPYPVQPGMAPAVMPVAMPPAGVAGQMPPAGYVDMSQQWAPPPPGYNPYQQQWVPPQAMPQGQPMQQQWQQPPQQMEQVDQNGASQADPMSQSRPMTPYEQQEAALRESQMVEQLEDVKQQKEMEESFRKGVLAEFDNSQGSGGVNDVPGNGGKFQGAAGKTKNALKNGMRIVGPTASWVGSMFVIRAIGGF